MTGIDLSPLHDVDIRLLRIFKTVVECKGLSASEETLGVGRSTISKYVADLEARFKTRLCERGRSGFTVTPNGQIVYEATIELLDSLDHFRSRVSFAKSHLTGSISLCIMDHTALETGNPLSVALNSFLRRPGDFNLSVNTTDPELVEKAVVSHQANVGLTVANNNERGVTYRPVGVERAALYCSSAHPVATEMRNGQINSQLLERHNFVRRGYLRSDPILSAGRGHSTVTAFHVEAHLQLILSGLCVGILPEHVARPWVETGRLIALPFPELKSEKTIFVAYRSTATTLPLVTALVADITAAYRQARPNHSS